ncbi:LPXTG cell wall anchor domain-containing protein [Streptomyces olindensis]|uniref:LPXTG cell wall anchor domain-containing protein n=1 Tax=Streptomyces olindensis TaxID=358823 RepID=A0ABV2XRI8_9ACTN
MRTPMRFGAVCAAASAVLVLAPAAQASPPGDNGTVKIHDASTGEELRRNEPHVCVFYLDAFGFDGGQQVDWHIDAIPPSANKGETVKSGALTLDGRGHGRSEDLSLPDGHYKLFWNFDGEKGAAKHKVFWTDCEDEEPGGGAPSGSASASPTSGASQAPSGEPGASASPGSSAGGGEPSSSPSPQGVAGGDLAETGSGAPVGLLSGVAAVLLAAGGFLVFRRRSARRG